MPTWTCRRALAAVVILGLSAVMVARAETPGDAPLPAPGADAALFTPTSEAPLFEAVQGSRSATLTRLEAMGPAGLPVSVRRMIVGPGGVVPLGLGRGCVLVDVRAGQGELAGPQRKVALEFGTVAVADAAGGPYEVRNPSSAPLVLEAVFVGR